MISLLLFISLRFSFQQNSHIIQLNEDDIIKDFIDPKIKMKNVYEYNINYDHYDKHLIFTIQPFHSNASLDINFNEKNPYEVNETQLYYAKDIHQQFIFVLQSYHQFENKVIILSVEAKEKITYFIKLEYSGVEQIFINDSFKFQMKNGQSIQIIHLKSEQIEDKINKLQIMIEILNNEYLELPIQVLVNNYENGIPTISNYDYIATDNWSNQKIIEFTSNKPNAEYYILIIGQPRAIIKFNSKIVDEIQFINQNQVISQIVDTGEQDVYQIEINQYQIEACDLKILLKTFLGLTNLYINPNINRKDLEEYLWKSKQDQNNYIIILFEDLKKLNITMLYIVIFGLQHSTYDLQVQCINYNQNILFDTNLDYHLKINQNDIIETVIQDNLNQKNVDIIIEIKSSNNIKFVITDCFLEQECPQKQNIFDEHKNNFFNNTFYYFNNTSYIKQNLPCQNLLQCQWRIIAIINQESTLKQGEFIIIYLFQQTIQLIENNPIKQIIEKGQFNIYQFPFNDKKYLDEVIFLLTPQQGQLSLQITMIKDNGEIIKFESTNSSLCIKQQDLQLGQFNISVYGNTKSYFLLSVNELNYSLINQQGQYAQEYQLLNQGDFQLRRIPNMETKLFKIDLIGYNKKNKISVKALLHMNCQIKIFANNKPEINIDNFKWKGNETIYIKFDDLNYPEILYLKIYSFCNFYYRLIFIFEGENVELISNSPFYSKIYPNEQVKFMYQMDLNQEIQITYQITEESDEFKINFTSYVDLDIDFYQNNSAYIRLKNPINCKDQNNEKCLILEIILQSNVEQYFTILISAQQIKQIQLYENKTLQKRIPKVKDYLYFKFEGKEVIIIFQNVLGKDIYVNIVSHVNQSFPNRTSFSKSSHHIIEHNQKLFHFSQNELQLLSCNHSCFVQITIENALPLNETFKNYYVQYTTIFEFLKENETVNGTLNQQMVQYYKINVTQNFYDLMILSGSHDGCEVQLHVAKNNFPTNKSYDWRSQNLKGNSIIIKPDNEIYPNLNGIYIIQVSKVFQYIFKELEICPFFIHYQLGHFKQADIKKDTNYKLYINKDEIFFLAFSVGPITTIEIIIDSPNSATYFFAERAFNFQSVSCYSKDIRNFQYNNDEKGYTQFLKLNQTNNYNYVILAVQSYISQVFEIEVIGDKKYQSFLEESIVVHKYLEKNETFQLLLFQNSLEIEIIIKLRFGLVLGNYLMSEQNQINFQAKDQFNLFNISNDALGLFPLSITAETDSLFAISFRRPTLQIQEIRLNEMIRCSLQPGMIVQYYYNGSNQYEVNSFSNQQFSIALFAQYSPYEKEIAIKFPKVDIYPTLSETSLNSLWQFQSKDYSYIEYNDTAKEYRIQFQNFETSSYIFYFVLNKNQLKILIPTFKQIGINRKWEDEYLLYASHQRYKILFYQIYTYSSYYEIVVKKWIILIKNLNLTFLKYVWYHIDQAQKPINFKIQMIKNQQPKIKTGVYTIRVYELLGSNLIPYDLIQPGGYGLINYNLEEVDQNTQKLTINYNPMFIQEEAKGKEYNIYQIEYFIIFSIINQSNEFQQQNYYENCLTESLILAADEIVNQIIKSILIPKESTTYFLNILAKVKLHDTFKHYIQLDYYYNPVIISLNQKSKDPEEKINYYLVFIISFLFIIIFVSVLRQIYKKYKNKQRLQYYASSSTLQQSGIDLDIIGEKK